MTTAPSGMIHGGGRPASKRSADSFVRVFVIRDLNPENATPLPERGSVTRSNAARQKVYG